MAIHSARNQYMGVNVHLNALLQDDRDRWLAFHAAHIDALISVLNEILPPHFRAGKAMSQQRRTDPDHRFYDLPESKTQREARRQTALANQVKGGPIVLPLLDTMGVDHRDLFNAVRIDHIGDDGHFRGAAAWIEILDAWNKPGGPNWTHFPAYYDMPDALWNPRIEIDYSHRHPALFESIPHYPDMPDSRPYLIHIWPYDRRRQRLQAILFGVDSEFPPIPLQLDKDTIIPDLKLGEAYNLTFTQNPVYHEWVDYAQMPSDFDTFSALDQQNIRDRMKRIEEAISQGIDLDENGPFMINPNESTSSKE